MRKLDLQPFSPSENTDLRGLKLEPQNEAAAAHSPLESGTQRPAFFQVDELLVQLFITSLVVLGFFNDVGTIVNVVTNGHFLQPAFRILKRFSRLLNL